MNERHLHILVLPGFLACLCLLLLNDLLLKQQFHNGLTGKLSDFTGLFVFPLFLTAFFPRLKTSFYLLTALSFIFWKSIYSQPLIDYWNSLPLFPVERTVDYGDLFALLILPLSYAYGLSGAKTATPHAVIYLIAAISLFAFTATSYSNKTAYNNEYYFQISKKELVERMSRLSTHEVMPQFWKADDFEIVFDSCTGRASITVSEKDKQSIIKLTMIDYRCPSGGDEQKMLEYFEQEFITKLREEPVTKSTQVSYIWPASPPKPSPSPTPR